MFQGFKDSKFLFLDFKDSRNLLRFLEIKVSGFRDCEVLGFQSFEVSWFLVLRKILRFLGIKV
jgi:hypothetical protein